MSLYLPTLTALDESTATDILNEASVYLEMSRHTLIMVHDSEPDNSHLKPILLGLDCLLFNTNTLVKDVVCKVVNAELATMFNRLNKSNRALVIAEIERLIDSQTSEVNHG